MYGCCVSTSVRDKGLKIVFVFTDELISDFTIGYGRKFNLQHEFVPGTNTYNGLFRIKRDGPERAEIRTTRAITGPREFVVQIVTKVIDRRRVRAKLRRDFHLFVAGY